MNRLLQLREKRHLSQQELGKILGVSQQQLSKYESGQSLMHSDFIIQCAEFFLSLLCYNGLSSGRKSL